MTRVRKIARLFAALVIATASQISCTGELAENRPYILTTATVGGTYYPVGVALATITRSKLRDEHGIYLSAISSAGSLENLMLLRDNQAQFALLQGVFAAWAWSGEGPITRPHAHLRSVSALWHNVEHFTVESSLVRTGTLDDIRELGGARFAMGARNSGAAHTGAYILESLGISAERNLEPAWMGYGATADALRDGNIAGMNTPAGVPVSAITRTFAMLSEEATILEFSDAELDSINERYPLWSRYVIPADTYPNQSRPVRSVSHPNVLAVRADVPDEVVYQVTRSIWENLAALQQIHAATSEMKPERALVGLAAPLHSGAARYYREQGLEIPAELEAP